MEDIEAIGVFFLNIELEVDDSRSGSGDSELRIRIGMRTLTQIMLFL